MNIAALPQHATIYRYHPIKPDSGKTRHLRIHLAFNILLLISIHALLRLIPPTMASPVERQRTVLVKANSPTSPPQQTISLVQPQSEVPMASGSFIRPVTGGWVTTAFSAEHNGIDIVHPSDPHIYAAASGTVDYSGCTDNGYGCYIILNHHNGYKTLYAHLSDRLKLAGETVYQGDSIGIIGATGNATSVHLHFSVLLNDDHVDPLLYIASQ